MHDQFSFRFATPADVPAVLDLIRQLAAYEHAADEVRATPEILTTWLFDKQAAEALLAVSEDGTIVGMAVFFQNFSTWTGMGGMYLEDLYVREDRRGAGVGRTLMAQLARICRERGWQRLDWSCLDWNEPSLRFYQGIGADRMDEWVHHRLTARRFTPLRPKPGARGEGGAAR